MLTAALIKMNLVSVANTAVIYHSVYDYKYIHN